MRNNKLNSYAAGLVVLGLAAIVLGARSQSSQVNALCISDAQTLGKAVTNYTQDYDETFPRFTPAAQFHTALAPYLHTTFPLCPATMLPYAVNLAISGKPLATLPNTYSVWLVEDSKPHPDGKSTVVYVNGYTTFGGVDVVAPTPQCVLNAQALGQAVDMYTQDWDETMPRFTPAPQFHTALSPYLNMSFPVCPVTGLPYAFNPAISGKPVATIRFKDSTWLVEDLKPHPDGKSTVTYVDGYTTYGGADVLDPNTECVNNVKQEAIATQMYAQDYDEVLPLYKTPSQYQAQLLPYVAGIRVGVCPATHTLYLPNNGLSAKSLFAIPQPAQMQLLRDQFPHADGKYTIGYLDGHVVRK